MLTLQVGTVCGAQNMIDRDEYTNDAGLPEPENISC